MRKSSTRRSPRSLPDRGTASLITDLTWEPDIEVIEVEPGTKFAAGLSPRAGGSYGPPPVQPTVGYRIEHDGTVVVIAGDSVPCDRLDAVAWVPTCMCNRDPRGHRSLIPSARLQDILDYHISPSPRPRRPRRPDRRGHPGPHPQLRSPDPAPGQLDQWRALVTPHFDGHVARRRPHLGHASRGLTDLGQAVLRAERTAQRLTGTKNGILIIAPGRDLPRTTLQDLNGSLTTPTAVPSRRLRSER